MAIDSYMDPGAAASNGFESALNMQAAQRHQVLTDQLAQQEAIRKAQRDSEEHDLAVQALAEKRQEMQSRIEDRESSRTQKLVENMQPGDIPDAVTVANAKKYGIPLRMTAPITPAAAVTGPGPEAPAALQSNEEAAAAPPPAPAAPSPDMASATPPVEGSVRMAPPAPPQGISTGYGVGTFAGSGKYLDEQRKRQQVLDYAATLPEGRDKQALIYEAQTGRNAPAGAFEPKAGAGAGDREHPVIYVDPRTHTMQMNDPNTGVLKTITAPPAGTTPHFMTAPPPVDDFKHDMATERLRTQQYNTSTRDLNTLSKPVDNILDSLGKLDIALRDPTPASDELVAPLVIRAFISGEGSGFRMTASQINALKNGRSGWENLKATLNHWDTDPSKALSLTPDQRANMRQLAVLARREADRRKSLIDGARDDMDNAEGPRDIQQVVTGLRKRLNPTTEVETAAASKSKKTAADYLKEAGIQD